MTTHEEKIWIELLMLKTVLSINNSLRHSRENMVSRANFLYSLYGEYNNETVIMDFREYIPLAIMFLEEIFTDDGWRDLRGEILNFADTIDIEAIGLMRWLEDNLDSPQVLDEMAVRKNAVSERITPIIKSLQESLMRGMQAGCNIS